MNTSLTEPLPCNITVHGGSVKEARGQVLAAGDIHAHNNFSQPDSVKPAPMQVQTAAPGLRLTLPPMSVAKMEALLI